MARFDSKTKYVLLVGDGMADYAIPEKGGKTPLELARTPHMDRLAACRIGLARTIPEGMEPGSDTANLSLLGYDPAVFNTGRAPFEAASMGVRLRPEQVAFRMNLVSLERKSDQEVLMLSHSAGDISTEEAREIVMTLAVELARAGYEVHPGVAYRHLLVWDNGPEYARTIPPHDVLNQNMAPYLSQDQGDPIPKLIRRSWRILEGHPVNKRRKEKDLLQANSIWLWGQGKAPQLQPFEEKFSLKGGVISAVDLLKGIGIYAGFEPIHVEGATGYLNTNYRGKAEGALKALERLDFMFVHVEAPDEAGHSGNVEEKIEAIELFDEKVVGTVLKGIARFDDYRVMVASDHFTPIAKRTHTNEATPFAWVSKDDLKSSSAGPRFTERAARESGLFFHRGHELMHAFLCS